MFEELLRTFAPAIHIWAATNFALHHAHAGYKYFCSLEDLYKMLNQMALMNKENFWLIIFIFTMRKFNWSLLNYVIYPIT